mmetsp:Transcript_105024/g.254975  ORF Transcript_105024/g.254975 Transcript_105024/m.254975 type:complete len:240 (+) Transcript_105024:132-851(+)
MHRTCARTQVRTPTAMRVLMHTIMLQSHNVRVCTCVGPPTSISWVSLQLQPELIHMHLLVTESCSLAISLDCASRSGQALPDEEACSTKQQSCSCGRADHNCRRVPSDGIHAVLEHAAGEPRVVDGGSHDKDSQQGSSHQCHHHSMAWQCRELALDGSPGRRLRNSVSLRLRRLFDRLCLQVGLHVLLACRVIRADLPHSGIARWRRCRARLARDGTLDRRHRHVQPEQAAYKSWNADS